MCCPPVSPKTQPFSPSHKPLTTFWSPHVWCGEECFFFARVQSDHHQPACKIVNPSQCDSSKPLVRAIRQELRSHSMILWSVLDRAAHLTPPPQGFEKSWRSQILAKYLGKRGLFGVIPNIAKILRQDSASMRSVKIRIKIWLPLWSYFHYFLTFFL